MPQLIPLKSMKKAAKTRGTNPFIVPNIMAPNILAITNIFVLIGANNNLSKERASNHHIDGGSLTCPIWT